MSSHADDQDTSGEVDESAHSEADKTHISTRDEVLGPSDRVAAVVVVHGPEIGRHYPIRRRKAILGRGQTADILIRHREVSREHAQIERLRFGGETLYRLTDLGSTNHVFVNGQQVDGCMLEEGDKIHLGEIVLRFELLDAIDARFHEEIRNRLRYDELTGLLTYESFQTALAWELERYAESAQGCAVVMMDLDDFKKLNDTYGHLAGSFVLREVGELIGGNLRHFDVAARYGGEEFVAYLPDTDASEALTAAERLRLLMAERAFVHQGRDIYLTISMGISHFPEDGRELEPLIQAADERLYRAKREGKNRVYID